MTFPNPAVYPPKGLHDWEDELKTYVDGVYPNIGLAGRNQSSVIGPGGVANWPTDLPLSIRFTKVRGDTALVCETHTSGYTTGTGLVQWNIRVFVSATGALVSEKNVINATYNQGSNHLSWSGITFFDGLAPNQYDVYTVGVNNASGTTGELRADSGDAQSLKITETFLTLG